MLMEDFFLFHEAQEIREICSLGSDQGPQLIVGKWHCLSLSTKEWLVLEAIPRYGPIPHDFVVLPDMLYVFVACYVMN